MIYLLHQLLFSTVKIQRKRKKKRLHTYIYIFFFDTYCLLFTQKSFFFRQYIKEQIKININDAYCERNIALVQEDGYKTRFLYGSGHLPVHNQLTHLLKTSYSSLSGRWQESIATLWKIVNAQTILSHQWLTIQACAETQIKL